MCIRDRVVPPVQLAGEPVSSTRIRQAVSQGEMELARTLLGRPYGLDFPLSLIHI